MELLAYQIPRVCNKGFASAPRNSRPDSAKMPFEALLIAPSQGEALLTSPPPRVLVFKEPLEGARESIDVSRCGQATICSCLRQSKGDPHAEQHD
jgi:hypothetical protein